MRERGTNDKSKDRNRKWGEIEEKGQITTIKGLDQLGIAGVDVRTMSKSFGYVRNMSAIGSEVLNDDILNSNVVGNWDLIIK